jgi:hypothetical protein
VAAVPVLQGPLANVMLVTDRLSLLALSEPEMVIPSVVDARLKPAPLIVPVTAVLLLHALLLAVN